MSLYHTKLTNVLFDPIFLFNVQCITLVFFIGANNVTEMKQGLTNPLFLFVLAIYPLLELYPQCLSFVLKPCNCLFVSQSKQNSSNKSNKPKKSNKSKDSQLQTVYLSKKQSMIARWYLNNAVFTSFLMDGLSSLYNLFPLMHNVYLRIDGRLLEPLSGKGMVATLAFELELVFVLPMALIVYYGYRCHVIYVLNDINNNIVAVYPSWVHVFEIIISVLHLCGSYFYFVSEILHVIFGTGLESLPFDWNLEFTFDYIIYFWFTNLLASSIWIIVPIYMIKRSINDLNISRNRPTKRD